MLFIVVAHIQNIIEFQLIFLLFDCGQLILGKNENCTLFPFFLLSLQEMKIGLTGILINKTPMNPIGSLRCQSIQEVIVTVR